MSEGPLVLVGPSGAGKTTIAARLVDDRPDLFVPSISATTREPRVGEHSGRDYHFVSCRDFEAMIANGELAEWARVHGEYYGTPARNLAGSGTEGPTPVLDIDVQGAGQVMEHAPSALVIFVVPPGPGRWIKRLVGRGTESPRQISRRLRTASAELRAASSFKEFVVNEDLDLAVEQVMTFVCRPSPRRAHVTELRRLCEELEAAARLEIARLEGIAVSDSTE